LIINENMLTIEQAEQARKELQMIIDVHCSCELSGACLAYIRKRINDLDNYIKELNKVY